MFSPIGPNSSKVVGVANGQQVLDLIEKTKPALVISDLMMPVMDGYTLLKNIRLSEQWQTVKVILISASHLSRQGRFVANEYANKPFDLDDLEALVSGLVGA